MSHEYFRFLEPRISSPFRNEFRTTNQGVAIVIFNRYGEVLLVQEGHDDQLFGRKKGHWNILTETREPDEGIKSNITRALNEEMNCNYSHFDIIPGSYRETNAIYNEMMGFTYKYRCLCLIYSGDPDIPARELFGCESDEITDYRWVRREELDYFNIEPGARIVLDFYYQTFHRGV